MSLLDPKPEDFEPGSNGTVLRNLLGITDPQAMREAETAALKAAVEKSLQEIEPDRQFTMEDLREMHRSWLGGIYPFASNYRLVTLAFEGMIVCPIPNLMAELSLFQAATLAQHTPCVGMPPDRLVTALAAVNSDLILIRPFRVGNARLALWLSRLMAAQAGCSLVDLAPDERYFAAVRQSFAGQIQPIQAWFAEKIRS